MDIDDQRNFYGRLIQLRQEHRDLDGVISSLNEAVYRDELQLRRMKIRKLSLKDQIAWLESRMIPDLDA